MTKWEYATVPLLVHATKQILDNWGDEGWELVAVVPGPNPEQLVAYRNRPTKWGPPPRRAQPARRSRRAERRIRRPRRRCGVPAARTASRSQRSAREGGHEMSESPEARLAALGLALPPVPAPLAAYAPAVRTGRYVYTAGQLPMLDGKLLLTGKVGAQATAAEAAALARTAARNALAAGASVAGGLSAVTQVVKMTGFVASDPGFTGQPQVVNGASELLLEVFGEAGRHARSA